jgi:hypothetical protein
MLMLLTFTLSLTAARRDPPPPLFYDSVIDKTWPLTPLAFTHSVAVTRSDLPSPLFPDGVTNSTPLPPPPSLLPLQPPPSHPSNIEVNIHFNLTLKIAFPLGIVILSIIGWISYKFCNTKPTMQVEAEIEI